MSRPLRKFVAVLLAIWLPLFSGNALAESVAMQSKAEDCHAAAAQQSEHHSYQASARHQHVHQAQLATNPDLPSGHHDQHFCNNHAVCHLACCGYVSVSVSMIIAEQQADRVFAPYLDTPRTLTLPLFDPPPIART